MPNYRHCVTYSKNVSTTTQCKIEADEVHELHDAMVGFVREFEKIDYARDIRKTRVCV